MAGGVRVVHRPLIMGRIVDDSMIWKLREIELWLAEVDKQFLGSLPDTSDYFVCTFTHFPQCNNNSNAHKIAHKLPISLHLVNCCTFVN